MSRPLVEVEIEGKKLNAVLDTGSRRSCIKSELTEQFPTVSVHSFEAKLGGETINSKEGRVVSGLNPEGAIELADGINIDVTSNGILLRTLWALC